MSDINFYYNSIDISLILLNCLLILFSFKLNNRVKYCKNCEKNLMIVNFQSHKEKTCKNCVNKKSKLIFVVVNLIVLIYLNT